MTYEVVVGLISNIVVLMSLSVVYSLFTNETRLSQLSSKLVMGISVSLVGFIVMSNAVEIESGIIFDGRSVLMILTGLYFGLIPTIVGSISLTLNRIAIGGSGTIPGILWVVIPAIFGLLWRWFRFKNKPVNINHITKFEQYLFLLINQILMVGILFLFPNKVSIEAINAVALPLVVAYPIGGFLVSLFMLQQRHNYFRALQVKDREKEYSNLFNKGSSYGFLINPNTERIMKVNQVAIEKYGYSLEEFREMTLIDIDIRSEVDVRIALENAKSTDLDYYKSKHILKNKKIIDVEVRSSKIIIDDVTYTYSTVTDITKRQENEEKYVDVNSRLKATLHSVTEGVISTNSFGEIEIINEFAEQFLDLDANKQYDGILSVVNIYSENDTRTFEDIYNSVKYSLKAFKSEEPYILLTPDEEAKRYIDFSLSPVTYKDNVLRGMILVFRDVTGEFNTNKQIKYVSQHDFLTGLYNRYFLETEMKRLNTKRQLPISIIHGDVNGLKLVNDVFGHFEGDKLIKEIASILKKATRSEDIIARWGGDEFIILLPQTSRKFALLVLDRIRDLQQKSMYEIMTPSISIGISTKNTEEESLDIILAEAENMMYTNKQKEGIKMRKQFLHYIENELANIHDELGVHSTNVMDLAEEFGRYLKLPGGDLEKIILLGKYHDIGWIGLDKELLIKEEPLMKQELDTIRNHPDIGFRIMKTIPELAHISEFTRLHHEWYDGSGYPSGIKETEIPKLSRIISIVDAYDHMTNVSVYRNKLTSKDALIELEKNSGTQFDPKLVKEFKTFITKKGLK